MVQAQAVRLGRRLTIEAAWGTLLLASCVGLARLAPANGASPAFGEYLPIVYEVPRSGQARQMAARQLAQVNEKLKQRDFDGAIADCDKAISIDPTFAVAYYARGTAKHRKHLLDAALEDFDHAIRLDPKFAPAYIDRAWVRLAKYDYDKAISDAMWHFSSVLRIRLPTMTAA